MFLNFYISITITASTTTTTTTTTTTANKPTHHKHIQTFKSNRPPTLARFISTNTFQHRIANMQLTYILAPLALASIAASWNLDLYGKDKRHVNFHGKKNTGCNTITFRPSLNVVRAKFDPATKLLPDPKTFELYSGASCNGL